MHLLLLHCFIKFKTFNLQRRPLTAKNIPKRACLKLNMSRLRERSSVFHYRLRIGSHPPRHPCWHSTNNPSKITVSIFRHSSLTGRNLRLFNLIFFSRLTLWKCYVTCVDKDFSNKPLLSYFPPGLHQSN